MSQTIEHILEPICNNIPDQEVRQFCKLLYGDVPADAISLIESRDLIDACSSIFKSMQSRPSHCTKINFIKLKDNENITVLEVIAKEIPFLVESISNELKKHGVIIHLIVHPSINVERKKTGELVSLGNVKSEKEAVMQFFIANNFSDDYYSKLKDAIKNTIECVSVVVEDWHAMQQQMKDAIKNINAKTWYKATNPVKKESILFLEWLLNNHFIFLGSVVAENEDGINVINGDNNFGITKTALYKKEINISEIDSNVDDDENNVIFIKKSRSRSIVHRDAHMNCIHVRQFDKNGKCTSVIVFLGFFTSSVYRDSVLNIPLIRIKINNVLNRYGYPEESYNAKEIVSAMEGFTRGDLIQMTEDELFDIATGMVSLSLMPRVKVFLRHDKASQLIHCFVFIPKAKFSAQIMQTVERIVTQQLYGTVSRYYVHVGEAPLTKLQIIVKPVRVLKKEYNIKKIEELVTEATSAWLDDLLFALQNKLSPSLALEQFNKFKDAFDLKYTSSFAPKQAVHDIKMIELAFAEKQVKFALYLSAKSGKDLLQLKIFSPHKELPLSFTLPTIENFGFFGVDTLTFKLALADSTKDNSSAFVHHFRISTLDKPFNISPAVKKNIETAMEKIYQKRLDDDRFNMLITYAAISWKEALIIRAYAAYLKQVGFNHSTATIIDHLTTQPTLTSRLIDLFNAKFSLTQTDLKLRNTAIKKATEAINKELRTIPSLATEQIFNAYIELINATKRTNFFQKINSDLEVNGLSFKIASQEISFLPLPKPFREIFVYSSRFEAVHLRGGQIARGGLRWSDRKDDFRTEILGLMKAQMTKNSVIVPVGSKGGFILKNVTNDSPDFLKEGIECYKSFLRAVLDVTDNIVNDKIIPPIDVIRHDNDDPYLVVAADKGTASFSDYANAVSKEYNFWLDDAFASGGSAGYDHKKMSITTRGAWISAQDHTSQFGINIDKEPFTAIGIGDMSGDVFGNGLLLSDKYKLIAAFNHAHIFIDPNPDPDISFQERKRMFGIPRSKWTDYDTKTLSKGGGIFSRSEKSITISPEARAALYVDEGTFTPDELINAILKAPVDVLWNGGIGTYVKSSTESNAAIGDKSNDGLRVNGKELRCRAVIEGGNLGATQLGRIEYSRNGGRINADFIDNSAGVDCSDHEVNIKIAFSDLMQRNVVNLEERNKILVDMTDEVAGLVLQDNKDQTLLISLEKNRGRKRLDEHFWLIKNLESRKELNRELEKLPSQEEFADIANLYGELTRPEICLLIAYAKNSAIASAMSSAHSYDKYLEKYVVHYFPVTMQERFKDALLNHKLKKELVITTTVNHFVNTLGCCLFSQLVEQGHDPIEVIHAFVIAADSFNLDKIWQRIMKLTHIISAKTQLSLFNHVSSIVERLVIWILAHKELLSDLNNAVADLTRELQNLSACCEIVGECTELYPELGAVEDQELIKMVNEIGALSSILYVIKIAKQTDKPLGDVCNKYSEVCEAFGILSLISKIRHLEVFDYASNTALNSMMFELEEIISSFAISEINGVSKIPKINTKNCRSFFDDLSKQITVANSVSVLVITLKRLKELLK